jgi:hypothetical protein
MVYDASEGVGDPQAPGGAAYVVNEWIDGETLAERLTRGPLPEREIRTVLRRLAEGVAEAHRVGLAVGGLTPDNVVLRPNGLVGLRGVPAATGTVDGDVAALGSLLEACMGGADASTHGAPDLVALARRARSTEPGGGLSSVAAMAALLAARPPVGGDRSRTSGGSSAVRSDDSDNGWLNRLRDRRADAAAAASTTAASTEEPADGAEPVPLDPEVLPPVPAARPVSTADAPVSAAALGANTIDAGSVTPAAGAYAASSSAPPPPTVSVPPAATPAVPPAGPDAENYGSHSSASARNAAYAGSDFDAEPFDVLAADEGSDGYESDYDDVAEDEDEDEHTTGHRLVVVGLPLLALAVVIALAYWFGSSVLSVAGSVDDVEGSTPSASASAEPPAEEEPEAASPGAPIAIAGGSVYDPFGDGDPDHPEDVPLSHDGDPATDWATYRYLGGTDFGGLKPGVGVVYDLGSEQSIAAVGLTTTLPGTTVEIRTGTAPDGPLESFAVATSGELQGTTELTLEEPATARYLLVWITGLVPVEDGAQADLAEVVVRAAA